MPATVYYSPFIPAFSSNGAPVPGAKLYFYLTGTTTKTPIYTTDALTAELTNPVEADASGMFPNIYLDDAVIYRVEQTDSDDVPLGDAIDPYVPGTALAGERGATGPASSTYTSLTALKAAPATNLVYSLVQAGSRADYYYETANAPYAADDNNVVKLDAVNLATGALVKVENEGLSGLQDGTATAVLALGQSASAPLAGRPFRICAGIVGFDADARQWELYGRDTPSEAAGHDFVGFDGPTIAAESSSIRMRWTDGNTGYGKKIWFGCFVDDYFQQFGTVCGASATSTMAIQLSQTFSNRASIHYDSALDTGSAQNGWQVEQPTRQSGSQNCSITHNMGDGSDGDVGARQAFIASEAAAGRTWITGHTTPTRFLGGTLSIYHEYGRNLRFAVGPGTTKAGETCPYQIRIVNQTSSFIQVRFYRPLADLTTGEISYTHVTTEDENMAVDLSFSGTGEVRLDHGFGSDTMQLQNGELFPILIVED